MGAIAVPDMVGIPSAAPGWWDPNNEGLCVWSAYQPKGAVDISASYIDLSGNGNNTGPGVAPAWDAVNGWKFDGATQYLTTTFQPQNDQSQSCIVQFTNYAAGQNYNVIWGAYGGDPAERWICNQRSDAGNIVAYQNGGFREVAPWLAAGNLAVAGNQGYRDGIAEGAAIAAWIGSCPYNMHIGCYNNAGVPGLFAQVYVQGLVIYDCTLTAPQVLSVATAMSLL